MSQSTYPERSWFDPRLEPRPSPIHGRGVFATAYIHAGEQLTIAGGIVFNLHDWKTGKVHLRPDEYNEGQIEEDLFLATPIEDMDYFFNHSCDPNMWGDIICGVTLPAAIFSLTRKSRSTTLHVYLLKPIV